MTREEQRGYRWAKGHHRRAADPTGAVKYLEECGYGPFSDPLGFDAGVRMYIEELREKNAASAD